MHKVKLLMFWVVFILWDSLFLLILYSFLCIRLGISFKMIAVLGGIFTMIYTLKMYRTVSRASESVTQRIRQGHRHHRNSDESSFIKATLKLSSSTNLSAINRSVRTIPFQSNRTPKMTYNLLLQPQTQLSFISPRLTITSIFIDQSLEYFLSINLISSEIDFLLPFQCLVIYLLIVFSILLNISVILILG